MNWSSAEYRFMGRAMRLADRASFHVQPNPRVGCVLVRDGTIVGEGWHDRAGEAHAEINALSRAGAAARGSDCYVTLEPCCHEGKTPPCTQALIGAGIKQVIVAMRDPNPEVRGQGEAELQASGIRVRSGLMQAQAEALNPGFLKRMRKGLPFVRCKMAMSLDGRTALANGNSRWISSQASRRDVHRLRARSSAVLTGINTVLADDPCLNIRHVDAGGYQPARIVVDSSLRMPIGARMLQQAGTIIIATLADNSEKRRLLEQSGCMVVTADEHDGRVDLQWLLEFLAREIAVNDLLLEAGATLGGKLITRGLVDELVLYTAPMLLGDSARGLFTLPDFEDIANGPQLLIRDIRTIGPDVRIRAEFIHNPDT
jgi:diaminohydroxyphosphoribosylaminopyrimidine deaminase/5-amino-6-(5-phosphoribosylamino)uracil reductase